MSVLYSIYIYIPHWDIKMNTTMYIPNKMYLFIRDPNAGLKISCQTSSYIYTLRSWEFNKIWRTIFRENCISLTWKYLLFITVRSSLLQNHLFTVAFLTIHSCIYSVNLLQHKGILIIWVLLTNVLSVVKFKSSSQLIWLRLN